MNKIVKAVFTLSAFAFIERLIGFLFKIYLSRVLGAEAIGVYQIALSFFLVLLTFITSGLPLVVSKQTARCIIQGDSCKPGQISTASLVISCTCAALLAVAVVLLRKPIGMLFADKRSLPLLLYMLPALFFSAVYCSMRGSLWGEQKYTLVSILELIEQVSRIIICIILFTTAIDKLTATAWALSLSCLVSATVAVVCYFVQGGRLANPRNRYMELVRTSMPITLARSATGLVNSLIAIVVPWLLISSGMTNSASLYTFGYANGMALPLLYIPLTFVGSMSFVLIPTMSTDAAKGDNEALSRSVDNSLSTALVIAAICLPATFALGVPICEFVYDSTDAGKFLAQSAWLLIPISLENIASSMMNSLDLEGKGLRNYLIGSAASFAIMLSGYGRFNILLMTLGIGVGLTLSTVLNIASIHRKVHIRFGFALTALKCAAIVTADIFMTKWTYSLVSELKPLIALCIAGSASAIFAVLGAMICDLIKVDYFVSKNKSHIKIVAIGKK